MENRRARAVLIAAAALVVSSLTATTFGQTPINDLGTGTYLGQYQGGLYPNGNNTVPAAHDAAGLQRAAAIVPRDLDGNPTSGGKYVLLSIGMSNTTQE